MYVAVTKMKRRDVGASFDVRNLDVLVPSEDKLKSTGVEWLRKVHRLKLWLVRG